MTSAPPHTIAVVGAGIVGLSTALYLQRDGHSVTVLDPKPPGTATSFGNAGIIATGNVAPVGMPGTIARVPRMLRDPIGPLAIRGRYLPRLLPWLVRMAAASRPTRVEQISVALHALLRNAEADYKPLWVQSGADALVRPRGWLKVYGQRASFDAMAAEHDLMRRRGIRLDVIGADEIRQLEPRLASVFPWGTFQPDCSFVLSPKRVVDHFAGDFVRRGGVIEQASVRQLVSRPPGWSVGTDKGARPVDQVVLCAGAWSRTLAAGLGARVPLDTERGYHVMLPAQPDLISRPVSIGDHTFTMVPMEHGIRLSTGVELAGLDAPPDFRRIRGLLAHAQRLLPGLDVATRSEWLGFRPSLPDSLPVIGPVPGHSGAWLAFGHQHLGLTLAAVTGRVIADLVAGRDPNVDLTPYRPDRRFF